MHLFAAHNFGFYRSEKLRQMMMGPGPVELLLDIFVVVLVDVSGGGDFASWEFRVPVLDLIAKAAGRLGDDFEAARCGAKN